jgi:hypothetical protein
MYKIYKMANGVGFIVKKCLNRLLKLNHKEAV